MAAKKATEVYRGLEYTVDLTPKVKVEMCALDDRVVPIIGAINASAKRGKIGDGKIFVNSIAEAIRIRNGEHGEGVL